MKILMKIAVATLLINSNSFALDMSTGNSKNQNIDEKKELQNSKSKTSTKNKSENKTTTKTKEKSIQKSNELTRVEQTTSLVALRALEKTEIEPFRSCQVLSKPRLVDDFGLSCRMKNGVVNSGRCEYLQSAAASNMALEDVISSSEIQKLKSYAACVALYGGLIAQDMKQESFSASLTDEELVWTFGDFADDLDNYDCRLAGSSDSIQCGTILIKLGYEPLVSYSNISLYSPSQTFFGYSSRQMRNKSKRVAKTFSLAKSKQKSLAINLSKTLNGSKSLSIQMQKSAASNLSLSKFIPGE